MSLLSLVRRPVVCTALLLACFSLAHAGTLFITIQGFIPTLTITTDRQVEGPSGTVVDPRITQTLTNVPFSGQFTMDSARLSLVTIDPAFAPFALRSFTDTDPTLPLTGTLGIDTDEWLSGTLSLGGAVGTTLALNRQLAEQAPAGINVFEPFNGIEHVDYMDGRDNLTQPDLLSETGDAFGFALQQTFSYGLNGPYTAGQEVGIGQFSALSMRILTNFSTSLPGVVHFFGPGAPSAFSWVDPVPGTCGFSDCSDGFFSSSDSFFGYTSQQVFAIDPAAGTFEFDTTHFSGSLIFSEVDASPVAAPEPASATLLLLAAAAGMTKFARDRRRPRPDDQ